MQHPTSQAVYAYWNEIRGERIAPRRFDVEPSQIGTLLAETFILECDGTRAAHFRLAGTKICETFGREFRGTPFAELFRADDRAAIEEQLDDLRTHGAVYVLEAEAELDASRHVSFEVLLMPLVHTGTSISRILGAIAAIDPPQWLGSTRLPALALHRHERIWPEGRPHAIAEKFRNQAPLISELSGARLVRVNRRSFRVLDGGLHKE